MKKSAIFVLLLLICCCTNDLSRVIYEFKSQKVDISVLSNQIDTSEFAKYKYIIYFDSTECSSCAIKDLWQWDHIIEECTNDSIGFYAILSPSYKTDLDMINHEIKLSRAKMNIVLDTTNTFLKNNSQLSFGKILHSFLINEKDSVVLVGNPTRNVKIKDLLFGLLKKGKRGASEYKDSLL